MAWVRGFVIVLGFIQGGFMIFDGGHALVTGDYFMPDRGPNPGRLGPWAHIVAAVGIPPRSALMKCLFIAYGSLLIATTLAFARARRWGRASMLAAEIGSLWYLGIGTLFAFTQILILSLLPSRPREIEESPV